MRLWDRLAAHPEGLAYYNEVDPFAAAWLRELITAGQIAPGVVDERSIAEVQPADLTGFAQCHFFAGIGGWSLALRQAGWTDDRPVWTGSCPCQPFSVAGARRGVGDARHLWPVFRALIAQCRPPVVFGEQVEAAIGHGWLDRVCDDLEAEGYAVGAVGLPAASVGAFHIRQRLWFVAERLANAESAGGRADARTARNGKSERLRKSEGQDVRGAVFGAGDVSDHGADGKLAESTHVGHERTGTARGRRDGLADGRTNGELADSKSGGQRINGRTQRDAGHIDERGTADELEHAERERLEGLAGDGDDGDRPGRDGADAARPVTAAGEPCGVAAEGAVGDTHRGRQRERPEQHGDTASHSTDGDSRGEHADGSRGSSFWSAVEWLPCRDGKARPVEPGTFPLAHGVSARMGRLRGYGNAIVPHVAQAFIEAYCACQEGG